MKSTVLQCLTAGGLLLPGLFGPPNADAQTLGPGASWVYTLTEGSHLVEDCPVCDPPTIQWPMRGTFQMSLLGQNPLFATYALENISFTAGSTNSRTYHVTGQGVYRVGGEVAVQQTLTLSLEIDNGLETTFCAMTNESGLVARLWPMLAASVDQTNGTPVQQYHLDLAAAPFREVWFATATPFTAGAWNPPTNGISAGDLLSAAGRVVRRNQQLTANLGLMPPVPDLGLKDVDVLPGGELVFSIAQDIFSESLGALQHGDLLSDRGRIVKRNQDLTRAFVLAPPALDVGLDAVQVLDSGETYFSLQTNLVAGLGLVLHPGDLLSDRGVVIRTGAQLLAAFNPVDATADYGLTALYVWPSGEIWFATAKGFFDALSTFYAPGDLLSDQGYVIYHNSELLAAFAPPAGATNLGLGALYVVSDATPVGGGARLASPQATNPPPASLALQWSGLGRVCQLERASDATGPYSPIGFPDTAQSFVDPGILTNLARSFYRVHQW